MRKEKESSLALRTKLWAHLLYFIICILVGPRSHEREKKKGEFLKKSKILG